MFNVHGSIEFFADNSNLLEMSLLKCTHRLLFAKKTALTLISWRGKCKVVGTTFGWAHATHQAQRNMLYEELHLPFMTTLRGRCDPSIVKNMKIQRSSVIYPRVLMVESTLNRTCLGQNCETDVGDMSSVPSPSSSLGCHDSPISSPVTPPKQGKVPCRYNEGHWSENQKN